MILLDKIKDYHLGWVIGILEGEGCFSNKSDGTYSLEYATTDKDMAEKFALLTGTKMHGPFEQKNPKHKDMYRVYVNKRDGLDELLAFIKPHMGERRQEQIEQMIGPKKIDTSKYEGVFMPFMTHSPMVYEFWNK